MTQASPPACPPSVRRRAHRWSTCADAEARVSTSTCAGKLPFADIGESARSARTRHAGAWARARACVHAREREDDPEDDFHSAAGRRQPTASTRHQACRSLRHPTHLSHTRCSASGAQMRTHIQPTNVVISACGRTQFLIPSQICVAPHVSLVVRLGTPRAGPARTHVRAIVAPEVVQQLLAGVLVHQGAERGRRTRRGVVTRGRHGGAAAHPRHARRHWRQRQASKCRKRDKPVPRTRRRARGGGRAVAAAEPLERRRARRRRRASVHALQRVCVQRPQTHSRPWRNALEDLDRPLRAATFHAAAAPPIITPPPSRALFPRSTRAARRCLRAWRASSRCPPSSRRAGCRPRAAAGRTRCQARAPPAPQTSGPRR